MHTKTIRMNVSVQSIDKAIKELEAYKVRIEQRLNQLIDRMCMDGAAYAILNLTHVDTGLTQGSIIGYREGNRGIIEVGGNAIWIEFGTGVLGNSGGDSVHENRAELGVSDWGTYGQGNGSNPGGWYYYDESDGGKLKHTFGIPMNPFMEWAAKRLESEFKSKAREVFSKI